MFDFLENVNVVVGDKVNDFIDNLIAEASSAPSNEAYVILCTKKQCRDLFKIKNVWRTDLSYETLLSYIMFCNWSTKAHNENPALVIVYDTEVPVRDLPDIPGYKFLFVQHGDCDIDEYDKWCVNVIYTDRTYWHKHIKHAAAIGDALTCRPFEIADVDCLVNLREAAANSSQIYVPLLLCGSEQYNTFPVVRVPQVFQSDDPKYLANALIYNIHALYSFNRKVEVFDVSGLNYKQCCELLRAEAFAEDIIPIVIGVEGHNFAEALRLFIYTEFYAGIVVYKFEGFKGSTFTHKDEAISLNGNKIPFATVSDNTMSIAFDALQISHI